MDITTLALRYDSLCMDLKRRMTASSKWTGLPALLDEIHTVRCMYRSQVAVFMRSSETASGGHQSPSEHPSFRYHGSLVL